MISSIDQHVIFVEDDDALRIATEQALELAGIVTVGFADAQTALATLGPEFAGAVVSDIRMPRIDGLQLLAHVRAVDPDIPVILVTGHGDVPMAVAVLQDGAFDFLTKPFATDRLVATVRRALDRRALVMDNRRLRALAQGDSGDSALVGDSPAMVRLRAAIAQLAVADLDVLVEGETGTGKELVALALHRQGPRRGQAFVAVNCGALSADLIEVELFGHASDSVPYSRLSRVGRIAASNGGTLLLDEVDSMALDLQAKLLRVIEEREVEPIGADRPQNVDLRVVATSKTDLARAVAEGRFRADLYYRLNTVHLRVPPLREREGDVFALFAMFIDEATTMLGKTGWALGESERARLQSHDWPGNVRELRSFAIQAVLGASVPPSSSADALTVDLPGRVAMFEAGAIEDALRKRNGNVAEVLKELGIPRKTFYDKVTRYRLKLSDFRAGS